jgi:hypothetical protein
MEKRQRLADLFRVDLQKKNAIDVLFDCWDEWVEFKKFENQDKTERIKECVKDAGDSLWWVFYEMKILQKWSPTPGLYKASDVFFIKRKYSQCFMRAKKLLTFALTGEI